MLAALQAFARTVRVAGVKKQLCALPADFGLQSASASLGCRLARGVEWLGDDAPYQGMEGSGWVRFRVL